MDNLRMKEKLDNGEAIDLSQCEREGNSYIIPPEMFRDDGVDYCNAKTEQWIWSIGRRYSDGLILASTRTEYYQNDKFECLWLR